MNGFERVFLLNPLIDWVVALAIAMTLAAALIFVRRIAVKRLSAYARLTDVAIDDALAEGLSATKRVFLVIVGLYVGAQYLALTPKATKFVDSVMEIALLVQAAFWANRSIAMWLKCYVRDKRQTDAAGATTVAVLGFIARVAVWALVSLMILDNLGFNITALVASLGIGGIAGALAVQNILGDIFASLSIALDKPFVIGDFIIVGDQLGTVEYIGLKTTRLRSLSGEQIIFSNADLLNSRVRNYKRMSERRVLFRFGVTYQTPAEKLERIPGIVAEIIQAQAQTRFDRAHFQGFGDSSLDFEVVYYVLDRDYNVYMNIQQAINLALFRRLADEGVEFAYPTRTLHLVGAPQAG